MSTICFGGMSCSAFAELVFVLLCPVAVLTDLHSVCIVSLKLHIHLDLREYGEAQASCSLLSQHETSNQ